MAQVDDDLAALFDRQVALHVAGGLAPPHAQDVASLEVYGSDVEAPGVPDYRIDEARDIWLAATKRGRSNGSRFIAKADELRFIT